MTRSTWRNIFVGIILLSIPCYLFGIFIWFTNGGGVEPVPTSTPTLERTPIDVTVLALTDPSLIVTEVVPSAAASNTPISFDLNLTPVLPTINSGITVIPAVTTTPVPTRFISPTPTTRSANTNTPVPIQQNTATPTIPQPILLPPTDTPNP